MTNNKNKAPNNTVNNDKGKEVQNADEELTGDVKEVFKAYVRDWNSNKETIEPDGI